MVNRCSQVKSNDQSEYGMSLAVSGFVCYRKIMLYSIVHHG